MINRDFNPQHIDIELLYLDLDTCNRCRGADSNLDAALDAMSGVLELTGHDVIVRKTHVTSEEQAAALGFVSSPTLRINGRDVAIRVQESTCGACSTIADTDVGCRTWTWQGHEYTSPPTGMIIDAILRSIYAPNTSRIESPTGDTPSSVQRFLAATGGSSR
jgi:hypothetical protein